MNRGEEFINITLQPKEIRKKRMRKLCSVRIEEGAWRVKGKRRKSEQEGKEEMKGCHKEKKGEKGDERESQ